MTYPNLRPWNASPMRLLPLFASALLLSAAARAQGDLSASSIKKLGQLLPEQAITWLEGTQRARGASSVAELVLSEERKLKVLLNPALRSDGTSRLPAAAFVLPGARAPSPELVEALAEPRPGDPSPLHTALGQQIQAFLSLPSVFHHSSEQLESLLKCIESDSSDGPQPTFVVLAVDAQIAGVDDERDVDLFEVQLSLRLFRVRIDPRRKHSIERLELLWADRGAGRATVGKRARPARGGWEDWSAAERGAFRDAAREAFGVAVIAALRAGPAVSLLANPRTLEAVWLDDRPTAIGPSLHDVTEGR